MNYTIEKFEALNNLSLSNKAAVYFEHAEKFKEISKVLNENWGRVSEKQGGLAFEIKKASQLFKYEFQNEYTTNLKVFDVLNKIEIEQKNQQKAIHQREEITLTNAALEHLNIPKDLAEVKEINASTLAENLFLAQSMLNKANKTNESIKNKNEIVLDTKEKTKIILSKESVSEIIKSCEDAIKKLKNSLEARLNYINNSNELRSLSSKRTELKAIPKKALEENKDIKLKIESALRQIALLETLDQEKSDSNKAYNGLFGNNSELQQNSNGDQNLSLVQKGSKIQHM